MEQSRNQPNPFFLSLGMGEGGGGFVGGGGGGGGEVRWREGRLSMLDQRERKRFESSQIHTSYPSILPLFFSPFFFFCV